MNLRVDAIRWLGVLLIGTAAIGTGTLFQNTGSNGRVYGESSSTLNESTLAVQTVETASAFHEMLGRTGRRGRVVVYLSRYLHFVPVDHVVPRELNRFPIPSIDLPAAYADRIDPKNMLWVVLQEGVAREIVHVLPRQEYEDRRGQITVPAPGIELRPMAIITNELGSRRSVQAELPQLSEPVILGIDAAYLDEAEAGPTLRLLRSSGLKADLVILNYSHDNPDVSQLGRIRLSELAAALTEAG